MLMFCSHVAMIPSIPLMMKLVMSFYNESMKALADGADMNALISMPAREAIGRFKYTPEDQVEQRYKEICDELDQEIKAAFEKEDL